MLGKEQESSPNSVRRRVSCLYVRGRRVPLRKHARVPPTAANRTDFEAARAELTPVILAAPS
jgi:hypothetical protein